MNKLILLVVLASVMASSVSCGTRKLAQNSFPLRFDRATEDFTGEFFDEYIDEADWLPETYEYDSLITEGWGAFSSIFGSYLQAAYDGIGKK